ncbi:hypothetical protein [Streptomyces sp. NPDC060022]|uniref:hypothetical protein n=1 Tax=Streptomyces sp. NPDC060022 TaxID=3347039 RepID=UPI00369ECD6B
MSRRSTSNNSYEPVVHKCTGTGTCTCTCTWEYDPRAGPWSQEVDMSVADCSLDTWQVFGTPEHPKLCVYVGDPDSWDLYILQPRGEADGPDNAPLQRPHGRCSWP